MEKYKNTSGSSGVDSYRIETESITVRFKDGAMYKWTNQSAGSANIDHMKKLALQGSGLNSFINTSVRKKYASKH